MSVSGNLFTYTENFRAYKALIAAQFSGAKVKVVSELPDFVYGETNKTPEFIAKFPSGQVPAFESTDGKVHLNDGNAIAHYLSSAPLRGETPEQQALVLQWINFSEQYVVPSVVTLVLNAAGSPVGDNQENVAREEFSKAVGVLNTQLEKQKYLTGESVSLADITLFADLFFGFIQVQDENIRSKNPKVVQWFQELSGQPQFKAVVGDVKLHSDQKKGGEKKEKKEKKEKAAKEEKPPKEEKKPKKKEEEPEEELDAAEEALAAEPVAKDPFLSLPPGTFNMDEFKRVYSNEDTITKALPYFWDKFDKENYSIWYCEYKFPSELTQVYMSCNLIAGMFQRLDKMRKNAFASQVLFGENNNSTISGVWIWRGQGLAFELSPDWAVDYESYAWKKLDPNAESTKTMVHEYFTWEGKFDGKKFNQGKIYK